MSDPENVRNLIAESVRILSSSQHEIKHRLLCSYTQKLQYVFPDDVPSDLSPLLVSIRNRLFKKPTYNGQSTVEAALYRMHRKTACAIAADIYELNHAMYSRGQLT